MMWEPTALLELKKRYGMTYEEAKGEMKRIKDKLKAYQEHEERQASRGDKINLACISASVLGSNELLILQNL